MTVVVGIDQSLSGTGMARFNDGKLVGLTTIKTKRDGHERLEYILDELIQFVMADGAPALVVVEGLSYGSFDTDRVLAGLSWIIRHRLWQERLPYVQIPPTSVKMFATGNGNAAKIPVREAVMSKKFRTGGMLPKTFDEADAIVLAAMGQRWMNSPVESISAEKNLSAMDKV